MSCGFTTDKLCVNAGIAEDKPSYGTVLNEAEICQVKYDDVCLSNADQVELLQQKEFINYFLSVRNIFSRDETIMSYDKEFSIDEDKEELIFLNGQRESDGQTSKTITELEDQNFILIKNEEVVSTRSYTCDKAEDSEDCTKLLEEIPSEMENLWHELSLLEKRLENQNVSIQVIKSELNENEEVHYSGQGQEDIIEIDGVEEILADSLVNFVENSNQHTDVLTEEEESEQHIDVLPKEEEALRPYVFYFNNCFVSAGLVVDAGKKLA